MLAVDRTGQVTDDQARMLSALVGAGREVALISTLAAADLPSWVPESAIDHGKARVRVDWAKEVGTRLAYNHDLRGIASERTLDACKHHRSEPFPQLVDLWVLAHPQSGDFPGSGAHHLDTLTVEWDLSGESGDHSP